MPVYFEGYVQLVITDPDQLSKMLTHLGEPTEPPVISPARGPPQRDFFDDAA